MEARPPGSREREPSNGADPRPLSAVDSGSAYLGRCCRGCIGSGPGRGVVVGAVGLLRGCFHRPISMRPALAGGLAGGVLCSLALVFKEGWIFFLLLPLTPLAASRSLVKRSPHAVTRRQGATVGSAAGLLASVVTLFVGVPAALVTGQIIWNNALQWAAGVSLNYSLGPDVLRSYEREQQSHAGGVFLAWLILSILSIGLGWLAGMIGVAVFQKGKLEAGHAV